MNVPKHKILNLPIVDSEDFYAHCQAYASLVSHWNTIINLVSTRNVDKLLIDLINQSIMPLSHHAIPYRSNVLDIGSGAGIPALPIKFMRPDISLTFIEPRRNKSAFLRRVTEDLKLTEIEVLKTRIEEVADRREWQGNFDLITTRGTGNTPAIFRMVEPMVKPGGCIWFYKGKEAEKEAAEINSMTSSAVEILEIGYNLSVIQVRVSPEK